MRFTVQAPDGRKVTLEGNHTPTEQELNQVFGSVGENNKQNKSYALGRLGTIDRGVTFGLGRKLGGVINAIGAYPVDRVAQAMGVENTPSFMERYHEIVDPTMEAINQYHEDKPVEALSLELGAALVNPANKVGVNFIKGGKGLVNTALRSGAVGGGVGTVAGALNTEKTEDVLPYAFGGGVGGAALGTALPVATNRVGAIYNALKSITMPEASVAGKTIGLGNVVKDNDSVRALTRGVMASDDVATQVLKDAPSEMGRLNEELSDILNKTTGRKLDIEQARLNADKAYERYIAANADYPVFNVEEATKEVPSIKDIVGRLNDYKAGKMQEALAKGASMSDYPMGSLDATHKAQGVLNDMIEASYDTSVIGVKKPTTETSQLMSLKKVFNNMLEPSGVKPLDARISKAKSMEYFRDMGYKFKPSETKFEDLGITTARDKRAFLQGRLHNILDNVKDDRNLSKAIRADENTLKKLMPERKFNELISETSRIDREYTRLNKLAKLAGRELDKPLAADRPMSERSETKMSYLGSLYDKANARMWQNANRRRAQALLNGGAVNPQWVQGLENYGVKYSPNYLSPYVAQLMAQNQ